MSLRRRLLRSWPLLGGPRSTRRPTRTLRGRLDCESLESRTLLATLTVGGGGQYTTIQAAVNNARSGDTIQVANGTYTESVNLSLMGSAVGRQPGNLSIVGDTAVTIRSPGGSAVYNSAPLTGNISLTGLTLEAPTNTAGSDNGLDANGLTGLLTLTEVSVMNAVDDGVSLRNHHGDFVFDLLSVIDTGDAVGDRGIELIDVDGFGSLINNFVLDVADTGVYVQNNNSTQLLLSVIQLQIFGTEFQTTRDALVVEVNGSARVDIAADVSIDELDGSAIIARVHNNAQLQVQLDHSNISGISDADLMNFTVDGSGSLNLGLSVNSYTKTTTEDGTSGSGLVLTAQDNAKVNFSAREDFYFDVGDSASDEGMRITASGNSRVNLHLADNSFNNVTGNGLHIRAGGSAIINAAIVGNSFIDINTVGGTAALLIDQASSTDTATINMVIDSNSLVEFETGTIDSIRLHQRGSSQFNLEGTHPNALTQLQQENDADNPVTVLGTVNMIGVGTIGNSIPLALGDQIWEDEDGDGIFDDEEFGLDSVELTLTGVETVSGQTINRSTATDFNGIYQFASLLPGTYTVTVVLPPGFSLVAANQGSDDELDSDFNPTTRQVQATLVAGQDNLSIDGGLVRSISYWQNPVDRFDVDANGRVIPLDALLVINALNDGGSRNLPVPPVAPNVPPPYIDVSGDNFLAPIDALQVINRLNNPPGGEGELELDSNLAFLPTQQPTQRRRVEDDDELERDNPLPETVAPIGSSQKLIESGSMSNQRDSSDGSFSDDLENLIELLAEESLLSLLRESENG